MSVARTARRRRSQAKLGHAGLKQVYGMKAAPRYPGIVSKEKSARLLANKLNKAKAIAMRRGSSKK